jgi:LysM repeat protein
MAGQTYTIQKGDTLSGIAAKYGISDYKTIASANNIANPNLIQAGSTIIIPGSTAPAPKPVATTAPVATTQPTAAPQVQPGQTTAAPTGSGPRSAADLVGMGYYGYQGWSDLEAVNNFRDTGGAGKGGPTSGGSGMPGIGGAPGIDLNAITQSAYNSPEIQAAQKSITDRQAALAKASADINDNPFYSEATRVGKQASLNEKANNDIKIQQGILDSLKADAAIKVNAAMGQYNIDEQAYKDKLSLFGTLVSSGALNNASSSDIANLSIQTGIPTSMIMSIQKSAKAKDSDLKIISAEDNTGQYVVAVNTDGTIAYKTKVGNAKPSGGTSASEKKIQEAQATQNNLVNDVRAGSTLRDVVNHYATAGGLSVEDIYRIYNSNTPYLNKDGNRRANETLDDVKAGSFSV